MRTQPDGRSIGARRGGRFRPGRRRCGYRRCGDHRGWFCPRRRPGLRPARRRWPGPGTRGQVPPAVQAGRQPGHGVWCGRSSALLSWSLAVVLDQHVEESHAGSGAVVAGEGHHGVFAGGQRITDGAVRGADRPATVDGDGPVGQRSRSGQGYPPPPPVQRGRWTPPAGMPCKAGVRVDVATSPRGAMPGQLRAVAGIKRRQGFGLYWRPAAG